MKIDISKIIVRDRIRKELGDIESLAKDIEKNGLIQPIAITSNNELIAGERRLEAHKLLGCKQIEVNVMQAKDYEAKLLCEIAENEMRKEFTPSERVSFGLELEKVQAMKAKERQGTRNDLTFRPNDRNVENEKPKSFQETEDIVAKQIGLGSRGTYRRAKAVVQSGKKDIIEQMDSRKIAISKAHELVTRDEEPEEQEETKYKCSLCGVFKFESEFSKGSKTRCKACSAYIQQCRKKGHEININDLKEMDVDFEAMLKELREKPSFDGNAKNQPSPIISRIVGFLNTLSFNYSNLPDIESLTGLNGVEEIIEPLDKAFTILNKIKNLLEEC